MGLQTRAAHRDHIVVWSAMSPSWQTSSAIASRSWAPGSETRSMTMCTASPTGIGVRRSRGAMRQTSRPRQRAVRRRARGLRLSRSRARVPRPTSARRGRRSIAFAPPPRPRSRLRSPDAPPARPSAQLELVSVQDRDELPSSRERLDERAQQMLRLPAAHHTGDQQVVARPGGGDVQEPESLGLDVLFSSSHAVS